MNSVSTLYAWFLENKEQFISCGAQLEFKDSGRGYAYVRLETDMHMIELSAWDHLFCLDIQISEIKLENTSFQHTGECASIEEFKEHLSCFSDWFKVSLNKAL